MATVRGVIADRIACGVTLVVRGSTSTNTGRRLFQTIAAAAARKVKLGITTSPSGSVRVPVRATPNRASGSIDATAHAKFSNQFKVEGFPTIKFFKPSAPEQTPSDYDGGRTQAAIIGFLEQKALSANAVKVVTENGVVFLMGLVTQREGPAYATVASRVPGVRRVVTLFEYITDEELAKITAR